MGIADTRKAVVARLETVLSKYGGEIAQCGVKTDITNSPKRAFDPVTGFWKDVGYVTNKPPRWIVHLTYENGVVTAAVPPFIEARRLCHHNVNESGRQALASLTRVIPAIKMPDGTFKLYEAWEWALIYFFAKPLQGGGAAQLIDGFVPNEGTLFMRGKELSYIDAALVGLVHSDEYYEPVHEFGDNSPTFGEATTALAKLIKVKVEEGATDAA